MTMAAGSVLRVIKNGCSHFLEVSPFAGQAADEDLQAPPRCSTLPARLPKDEPAFERPHEFHPWGHCDEGDSDEEEAEEFDSTRAVAADSISNSLSTSSASAARRPEGLPLKEVKQRWASIGSCLSISDEDSQDALEPSEAQVEQRCQVNSLHSPAKNADQDGSAPSRSRHSSTSSFEPPPSSGSGATSIEACGSSGSTSGPSLPKAHHGFASGGLERRPAAVGPITHAKNSKKKLWCHFYLDEAMLHMHKFNLNKKIIGNGGEHTKRINEATDAKVRLRGKGSGHPEKNGREADVPLMVAVTLEAKSGEDKFCEAVMMAIAHLLDVQRKYKNFLQRERYPVSADQPHIRIGGMSRDAEILLQGDRQVQDLLSVAPFGHHSHTETTATTSNIVAQTSQTSWEMPASQPKTPRQHRNRRRNGSQAAWWH